MAAVTASHFVSHAHGAVSTVDGKTTLAQIGLRNTTATHDGLRSVSKNDVKMSGKVASKQSKRMIPITENGKPRGTVICGTGMNAVLVSTECGPWCKTGGMGDVVGGLPPALAAFGHRVMTVCPRYDQYKDAWDTDVLVEIEVGNRIEAVRFFHCYKRGVDRVFVDHPWFLERLRTKWN